MNREEALARHRRAYADRQDAFKSLQRAREVFNRASKAESQALQALDLSIPCPSCAAQPGERCTSRIGPTHVVRREAARQGVER